MATMVIFFARGSSCSGCEVLFFIFGEFDLGLCSPVLLIFLDEIPSNFIKGVVNPKRLVGCYSEFIKIRKDVLAGMGVSHPKSRCMTGQRQIYTYPFEALIY